MFKKKLFMLCFVCIFNTTIEATEITEKELLTVLNLGVKETQNFLKKVAITELYNEDKTILHYAVELQKYDIVELLISENVELYRQGGVYYETALQDAIFYQYFRIARLLINSGTPLDIQNIDGDTALHIASKNGYIAILEELINSGASKTVTNAEGLTAYDVVQKFGFSDYERMREMLKPSGASSEKLIM